MTYDSELNQLLAQNAVDWAVSQLGSEAYAFLCLAFVEDAYEVANGIEIFGGSTAKESADLYGVRKDQDPPFGAFVFYDCVGTIEGVRKNWGHVGLAIGDGKVIHAWHEVRIDNYLAVKAPSSGSDWTQPSYIGYAPPDVILEGSELLDFEDLDEDDLLALFEAYESRRLSRAEKLAAEFYGYSYDHYADHRGNIRFDELMPEDVESLERAEAEGWDTSHIARALEIPKERVPISQKHFRQVKEIVDAPTPAESFRRGVRFAIQQALEGGLGDKASVERLVTQICYRAADLGYLLAMEGEVLAEYSEELRTETEYDSEYWDEVIKRYFEDEVNKEEDVD